MATYVSPTFEINRVLVADMTFNVMMIPIHISNHTRTSNKTVETQALIDSGAAGSFIDFNFAKRNNLPLIPLEDAITAYNVDGTENKKGTIRFKVDLPLEINGRKFRTELFVTGLGRQKIILGCPWLKCLKVRFGPVFWPSGSETGTETGPSKSRFCKRPDQTDVDRSFAVLIGCKTGWDQLQSQPVRDRSKTGLNWY